MIAILSRDCTLKQKSDVVRSLESEGYRVTVGVIDEDTVIGVLGSSRSGLEERLAAMPGVRETQSVGPSYALVARAHHPQATKVKAGGVTIGGRELVVIAGPCSIESEAQMHSIAASVAASGAGMLRGGAFKPRTSPYGFQGLGEDGLRLLAAAGREAGLPVVSEVVGPEDVELVSRYVDVLQIGARSMQNFRRLRPAAQTRPLETVSDGDDRRVLERRGVHRDARQSARRAVRARDSDV
jgi:3-deoxy-7-phosphoheptulonate synthase